MEKAAEGEEKAAATATVTRVAEEAKTVVDEVAKAEVNLRVAASKGDMAALALAEQAHCYHMPHSPSPALSALSRSARSTDEPLPCAVQT